MRVSRIGLSAVVLAAFMLVFALSGRPGSSPQPVGQWETSFPAALARAQKTGQYVFLDLYAEGCPVCEAMVRDTYSDPRVQQRLKDYVAVRLRSDSDAKTVEKYGTGLYPTHAIVTPEGKPLATSVGLLTPEELLKMLQPPAPFPTDRPASALISR